MVELFVRIYSSDINPDGEIKPTAIERECRLLKIENHFPVSLVGDLRKSVSRIASNISLGSGANIAFKFIDIARPTPPP
jgi:hypothetical protein